MTPLVPASWLIRLKFKVTLYTIFFTKLSSLSTVHLDLQCPDCLEAWPGLLKMADHYGKQVKLSVVVFPLPYHRAAYKCKFMCFTLETILRHFLTTVRTF